MTRITERNTWPSIGVLTAMAAIVGVSSARVDAQGTPHARTQVVQIAPAPHETIELVTAAPMGSVGADVVFIADGDQPPPPPPPPPPGAPPGAAMPGKPFEIFMGGDGKVVTGAPYAADAVTEMVQTLADGNRIVQRQSASVARDGQGRTRREMAIAAIGPVMPEDPPRITFVHDPVAGVVYQFNDVKHTATRRTLAKPSEDDKDVTVNVVDDGPGTVTAGVAVEASGVVSYHARTHTVVGKAIGAGAGPGPGPEPRGEVAMHVRAAPMDKANTQTESLGTQAIEGVQATGTRTTTTIPAGTIGNEQPIKIVSESWYSPELQALVLTKRSDPRFGETTYKLTNIVRAEPSPSLFDVPAGYTITDEPDVIRFKISRDQQDR